MIDFLSVGVGRFRKFGFPFQFRVNSQREIVDAIQKYNGIADCYLSISEHQEIDGQIRTFPLFYLMDFDITSSSNISDVENEVAISLNWLEDNKLNYQLDFSGRGYHILIELSQHKRIHNIHFRNFYYYITNQLKLKTLDPMCSEIMRIKRIPETINLKSNKLCCTLLKNDGDCLDLFNYIEDVKYKNNESRYEIKDYCSLMGESHFVFPFPYYCPCIDEEVKGEDVDHNIRWRWIKVLQKRGLTFKEIYNECKEAGWSDFTPSITEYQIRYCLDNDYVLKCNKEICIDRCPLRKNIKK